MRRRRQSRCARSFFSLKQDTGHAEKLGIPQDDFIVFSFGGSLGAEKINEVACELMQDLFNGHEGSQHGLQEPAEWYYDRQSSDKQSQERGIRSYG